MPCVFHVQRTWPIEDLEYGLALMFRVFSSHGQSKADLKRVTHIFLSPTHYHPPSEGRGGGGRRTGVEEQWPHRQTALLSFLSLFSQQANISQETRSPCKANHVGCTFQLDFEGWP